MMEYTGKCKCGRIQYSVNHLPQEIANCHCTICQKLHKTPFVSFTKYKLNQVMFNGQKYFQIHISSERAVRCQCSNCYVYIFMYYNESDQIWLITDTFNFSIANIPHYDIYTDTAIVPIPEL